MLSNKHQSALKFFPYFSSFVKLQKRRFFAPSFSRFSSSSFCALHCNRFFSSSSSSAYDVVVIGGGPGGYVAAIKCAQLGLRTACVEGRGNLGGTCLNVGCIPSKAILNISHKYYELRHDFANFGILVKEAEMSVEKMMKAKEKTVKALTDGIELLFKRNKVDYIKGWGSLLSGNEVEVEASPPSSSGEKTKQTIEAKNIILATGSESYPMPGNILPVDEKVVVSSTGALEFKAAPKKMIVIGGGVIGLELGSAWSRLGTQVEVVEYMDRLCPALDNEIVRVFQKALEKQGLHFHLATKVVGAEVSANSAVIHTESANGGEKKSLSADVVLVSVGRRPYTQGLNLEKLDIQLDKAGRVVVDEEYRVPNVPSIRAIGDVIYGPMLAHKAEDEGLIVAEMIAEVGAGHVNYDAIPSVVYTHPELAGVGFTENQLKEKEVEYKKGTFPFAANSRAKTNQDTEGMVKILVDAKTDKLLGAWLLGPYVGELISELVLGMEYGASSEDIARTTHAHPTLSEAVKEACMATCMKPIHIA